MDGKLGNEALTVLGLGLGPLRFMDSRERVPLTLVSGSPSHFAEEKLRLGELRDCLLPGALTGLTPSVQLC